MTVARQSLALERSTAETITALAAGWLRMPPGSIGLDVPLARLGLDSLGCIELGVAIEEALGRPVPPEVISESATVRSLCEALEREHGGNGTDFRQMRADAVLPDDIIPKPARDGTDLRKASTILLTGATGFLGAALLRHLLDQTAARIVCVVRSTREEAVDRIEKLTRDLPCGRERIEAVEGDLALPRLGLASAAWAALRRRIEAVCHAGASISWVHPYQTLRRVNVVATRDLLRLASEAGASFHFVSSLSVCYSTKGPPRVDESFGSLDSLEGLHFGYAQTKAVAEALVRQARERGLRTRIYRPAIISGDSRSGSFNPEDLLSSMIAACVRMGRVPDLNWSLDAIPVDSVADAIVCLSGSTLQTLHLGHPRPRHWRECALWMRLYGYDVRLVPYREWAEQLRNEAAVDLDHPLRALRSFFLDRTREGLSVPELHEDQRRPRAEASMTMSALARTGGSIVPLNAALMERYFDAFVRAGRIPQVRMKREVRLKPDAAPVRLKPDTTSLLEEMLRDAGLGAVRQLSIRPYGSDHSIIGELTAWRSGSTSGVFGVHADGRDLILKVKPHSRDSIAVGEALASLCGERLGSAFATHGSRLGLNLAHVREIAIYREPDPSFRACLPAVLATRSDPPANTWAVLLERVDNDTNGSIHPVVRGAGRNAAREGKMLRGWPASDVEVAIDGLAVIQARWLGRDALLRQQPWLDEVRSTRTVEQMEPLWSALAEHAAPMFASWAGSWLPAQHRRLIERIAIWRPAQEALPQTLIHNDFNPRNVCLRVEAGARRLCAFDWELATLGPPTRDLAEFICFVARPDDVQDLVPRWIERHRLALVDLTGVPIDREAWRAAFGSVLCELLIDRLSVYAMVQRVKPQPFLPEVLRTWRALFRIYADDAFAP